MPGILEYIDAIATHHGVDASASPVQRLEHAFALFSAHEQQLAAPLLGYLSERSDVRIIGKPSPNASDRVPTISFVIDGVDSATIPPLLDAQQLAVRFGHFYAHRAIESLGLHARNGVVRISFQHYNEPAEIERLLTGLDAALTR